MKFYFECPMGCGIREAEDLESARSIIKQETGTYNEPSVVRVASQEDVAWVKTMGGDTQEPG